VDSRELPGYAAGLAGKMTRGFSRDMWRPQIDLP